MRMRSPGWAASTAAWIVSWSPGTRRAAAPASPVPLVSRPPSGSAVSSSPPHAARTRAPARSAAPSRRVVVMEVLLRASADRSRLWRLASALLLGGLAVELLARCRFRTVQCHSRPCRSASWLSVDDRATIGSGAMPHGRPHRRRALATAGVGLAAAGLVGAARRIVADRKAPGGPEEPPPIRARSRNQRRLELARVGGRTGADFALHRARRTFAGAERQAELDHRFGLRTAEQVTEALGNMKGAFMKLGQMASYLDTGLPDHVRQALAGLQQDAPPMSADLAASVVERELGAGPDQAFLEWDPVPIAAASIGQVHRAITSDERAVAVKVQYPGVDEAIRSDLAAAGPVYDAMGLLLPGFDPGPVLAEIRARVSEELDYANEARNQQLFADFYRDHPFISVPDVLMHLSTPRVLTTELAEGARFEELAGWDQDERDRAGEAIYRFVFRSLYRLQAFNGDPHPGNYLFRPGGRVTFLDFGLVKHFTPPEIGLFGEMIRAMVMDGDTARYRRIIERIGLLAPGTL